ncbi:iron-containing alcohol dehydrogenase [Erwinia tracheiphila]|uniref:Alcohol dehydrogenase n=1 Tax=Erwinia tracheiphila TaxID=65700 RepID=A0A0M2KLE8_9GAMM|nr:iron-containing alcohol dehydrogenase [Erwinia tracheiphila]AXF75196.1 iron-containing alcohol dehydrogenase [Erwinia tracheiphila]EOS94055.1 Iron-containing alcohol dehydrogenase [Erwinia tracheiphila PSU-1]KKF38068.1 alcohol dehydrogenase [Erwinia tracheiphila]UIA82259.1 iron-containing alcohol dehydrogenase [Erwinia tracheiphila]UIA89462.1 iron-containing alcohol dehydrogenase [Erwinia tracheiphila]
MIASQMIANRQTFFGRGSLSQLLPLLADKPAATLLFCGRSFLKGTAWSVYQSELEPQFIGHEIVSHEASPAEIDAWVERWRGKVERVVAIGGGSVLDAAKAFAALSQHPLNTLRYLEKVGDTPLSGATLPLIAIPTTAGTGSEVTQNAVVTDKTAHKVKASLRHANFVPQIAILDADLLRGTTTHILTCCAIDTFTHLFEAWLSCKGNLFTRQTALSGMRAFINGWPYLDKDGSPGDQAREQMLLASWQGGLSLSMAGLGVIHGIAGELGAIKNYHHGEVCGRLLLPFLELLNKTENPEQQALMADLAAALFPVHALSPAKMLAEWLKDRAIAPFWQDAPPLTVSEIDWILARSNSKNSLVTYSKAQQRFMLESAFSVQ